MVPNNQAEKNISDAKLISLIQPQFEMGKGNFNSKDVVVNEKLQEEAIEHIQDCIKALDLEPKGILNSRVLAGDGNKKFLACFTRNSNSAL
jgi:23S rRNA (cytidine1920-2'-O)/16S rRNA (cytidine1409-2'-O)-methyltransferase